MCLTFHSSIVRIAHYIMMVNNGKFEEQSDVSDLLDLNHSISLSFYALLWNFLIITLWSVEFHPKMGLFLNFSFKMNPLSLSLDCQTIIRTFLSLTEHLCQIWSHCGHCDLDLWAQKSNQFILGVQLCAVFCIHILKEILIFAFNKMGTLLVTAYCSKTKLE